MRRQFLAPTFLVLSLAFGGAGWGQATHEATVKAQQEIAAISHSVDVAMNHRDVDGCMAALADDFKGTDLKGTVSTRADVRKSVVQTLAIAGAILPHTTIEKVTLSKDGKMATVLSLEMTEFAIAVRGTTKIRQVVFNSEWRSVWSHDAGKWLVHAQKQLSNKTISDTILGEPKPAAPAGGDGH